MLVKLLHHTPLEIADKAIGKCWDKPSPEGTCNTERIYRVGNKNKHASTLEHLNYSFDIDGISRACLQELARHRHASLSVKSTRYTLKELVDSAYGYNPWDYMVKTNQPMVDAMNIETLESLKHLMLQMKHVDYSKFALPEAYKTSLVWTINARSLQNFIALRTNKAALWEIQDLANEIFNQLPEEHKYLFQEFIWTEDDD